MLIERNIKRIETAMNFLSDGEVCIIFITLCTENVFFVMRCFEYLRALRVIKDAIKTVIVALNAMGLMVEGVKGDTKETMILAAAMGLRMVMSAIITCKKSVA